MKRLIALVLIVLSSGVVLSMQKSRAANDEAEIRQLWDRRAKAFRAHDVNNQGAAAAADHSYHDPRGRFTVDVPPGWTAAAQGADGEGGVRLTHHASWGIIGPFRGDRTARDVVQHVADQLNQQYRSFTLVKHDRGDTRFAGQPGAFAIFTGVNQQGTSVVLAIIGVENPSGDPFMMMFSVPQSDFSAEQAALDQIQNSFQIGRGAATPQSFRGATQPSANQASGNRAIMGAQIADVSPEVARQAGMNDQEGVLLGPLVPGGPAEKAGMKPGDIIIALDNRPVERAADLLQFLAAHVPGDKVEVLVLRNRQAQALRVTLGAAPSSASTTTTAPTSPTSPPSRAAASALPQVSAGQAGTGQVPAGWVTHNDPAGFSIQVPRGWRVGADAELGRVVIQGIAGERVEALPIFLQISSVDRRSATEILQGIARKLWPDTVWEPPQFVGSSTLNQRGRSGNNMATSILTWISTPNGTAGYVYFLSAPEVRYRQELETFARILESFSAFGTTEGAQPKEPSLSFTRWQDPRENAFMVEVPDQWRVQGGTFRFAPIDVRSAVEATSPDGQVRVTLGDREVPMFITPSQTLTFGGFREGSWYSPGSNVNLLVMRYLPGKAFAKDYVMRQLSKVCSAPQILEERDRPDVSQPLNAMYATNGLQMRLDAGEVAFTCQQAGQLKHGIYFAGTQLVGDSSGGGVWHPEYLFGYLASAGKQNLAQAALNKLIESFEINPQWQQMQQNVTMNTSRIVSEAQAHISKNISDAYWNRAASQDRISQARSNQIRGVTQVVDPVTGDKLEVDNSKDYHWIDHGGNIVGTNTSSRPSIDFRELIRAP